MVFSNVGYCLCGAEIWVEYLRSGDQWEIRFFSPDHQEISFCPDCGRKLDEDELESM